MGSDEPSSLHPESVDIRFRGKRISLAVERWPGGIEREVVYHPGACAAVVFVDESNVLMVRQTRQAVRRETLEVVAGTRDVPGETPEDTIRREIEEETGHRVTGLTRLGSILTTPGFTSERIELFTATAEPTGAPPSEDGIDVVTLPFDQAIRMALSGEIEDAKSVVALLLLKELGTPD